MPKKHLSEKKCIWILYIFCICLFALTGCDGTPSGEKNESSVPSADEEIIPDTPVAASPSVDAKGSRDNTSVCLVPQAAGTVVYSNELAAIDVSNAKDGYICAKYTGSCPKVKLQINFNGSDTTYKYDLKSGGYEIFPLTSGSGTYSVGRYYGYDYRSLLPVSLPEPICKFYTGQPDGKKSGGACRSRFQRSGRRIVRL